MLSIIKRLKQQHWPHTQTMNEAAETISRLEKALEPFTQYSIPKSSSDAATVDVLVCDLRNAREALKISRGF